MEDEKGLSRRAVPGPPPPTKDETLKAFRRITDLRRLRHEQIDIKQLHAESQMVGDDSLQELLDVITERIKQLESLDAAGMAELKAAEEAEDRAEELREDLLRRAANDAVPIEVVYLDDWLEVDD